VRIQAVCAAEHCDVTESAGSRCEQLARQLQVFGRVIPTAATAAKINALTAADVCAPPAQTRRPPSPIFRCTIKTRSIAPSWRKRSPSRRLSPIRFQLTGAAPNGGALSERPVRRAARLKNALRCHA
jgi:hypothetical protein